MYSGTSHHISALRLETLTWQTAFDSILIERSILKSGTLTKKELFSSLETQRDLPPHVQTSQYIFEVLTQKCNSVATGQTRGAYAEGVANILQRLTPEGWKNSYDHFQTELRSFEFAKHEPAILRFLEKH